MSGEPLAVLMPGMGYHSDKPLMYFTKRLLRKYEIPFLDVDYGPMPSGKEHLEEAACIARASVTRILEELRERECGNVIVAGKSIGTIAACCLSEGLRGKADTHLIAFTPVNDTISHLSGMRGIVFSGTADPFVSGERLKSACEREELSLHLLEGGNHSLETGDIFLDLENLKYVMRVLDAELQKWCNAT